MSEGSVQWSVGKPIKVDPLANEVLLRGISVSPRLLKLNVGDSYKLNVDLIPKNATFGTIEWFACDFNYATLKPKIGIESDVVELGSRGNVTAMLLGQARITARIFIESRSFSAGNELCRVMVIEKTDVPPGTITVDGFGGWYNPSDANTGVKNRLARFVQMKSGPCVAYSIMMGDHYLNHYKVNPTTYFNDKVKTYLSGVHATAACTDLTNRHEFNRTTLKEQLDAGRPVVISGQNSRGTDHFAVAVAYNGNINNDNNIIVVDPLYKDTITGTLIDFPMTFKKFKEAFPNNATNIGGFTNPMFTFKELLL